MATNLEIANQALLELGSTTITQSDFDTPTSAAAKVVSPAFSMVLNEVVSDYDFPDLRVVAELTSAGTPAVDTEFDYYFTLPSDFNILNKVTTSEGYPYGKYRLEQSQILGNEDPLFLHYSKTITDASVLPDYLVPAIIYKLAARIAKPLTGEINERNMMNQEYEKAFKRAKRRASQDKVPMRFMTDANSAFIGAHEGHSSRGYNSNDISEPYAP
jgi:hypothetical protein